MTDKAKKPVKSIDEQLAEAQAKVRKLKKKKAEEDAKKQAEIDARNAKRYKLIVNVCPQLDQVDEEQLVLLMQKAFTALNQQSKS